MYANSTEEVCLYIISRIYIILIYIYDKQEPPINGCMKKDCNNNVDITQLVIIMKT